MPVIAVKYLPTRSENNSSILTIYNTFCVVDALPFGRIERGKWRVLCELTYQLSKYWCACCDTSINQMWVLQSELFVTTQSKNLLALTNLNQALREPE